MNLFRLEDCILSSGLPSKFKIECDVLTEEDWECLAYMVSKIVKFSCVTGVPTGGKKLEYALKKYENPDSGMILIVDDVLTTGNSMFEHRKKCIGNGFDPDSIIGVVVFSRRTDLPEWVTPLFSLPSTKVAML